MMVQLHRVDLIAFRIFNGLAGRSHVGDALIRFCAGYLLYVMIAGIMLFVAITFLSRLRASRQKNIKAALFIALSAFIARVAIAEPIRFLWHRERPFESLAGVRQLVAHPNGASFPSGHASLAFGIAVGVAYYYPKTSIVFFAVAMLVGMGRIVAGVHWPSDILGGALAGAIGAFLARRVAAHYFTPPPPFFHGTDESRG